jgi:hypothetical protein
MISQEWFADQVAAGNGYVFESALAGVALIAATTSANKMLLVNPVSSERVFIFQKITYGRTAVGTPLEGAIVYNVGLARSVSVSAGTGNDVVSYTAVAGQNLRSDLGNNSGLLFAPATSVVTTAPTFWGAPGIAQTADNGATTVSGPRTQLAVDHINGMMQLFPGTLFTIGAAVSLSTTYHIAIYGVSVSRGMFNP